MINMNAFMNACCFGSITQLVRALISVDLYNSEEFLLTFMDFFAQKETDDN